MRKKRIEIVILNDMVNITTDDFNLIASDTGGGVQGMNEAQEQSLVPLYKQMAILARKIAESPHSAFVSLVSFEGKKK